MATARYSPTWLERFDGICFYASVLTAEVGAAGDFGFCTPSCNCSEQCNDPTLSCQLLEQGALGEAFKGPGLCFAADAASTPYEECATWLRHTPLALRHTGLSPVVDS